MTNQIQRTARAGPKEPVTADILVREPQDVVTFEREEREGKDSLVRGRESMDLGTAEKEAPARGSTSPCSKGSP